MADYATELFPNPSTGISTLTFEHEGRGKLSVEIFDLQGKRVFKKGKINFDTFYKEEINLSNQPSGLYIVELNLDGKKFTKELVISKL